MHFRLSTQALNEIVEVALAENLKNYLSRQLGELELKQLAWSSYWRGRRSLPLLAGRQCGVMSAGAEEIRGKSQD